MLVASILLWSLQHRPDPPLNYENQGARLEVILKDLDEQFQFNVKTVPALQGYRVALSIHDRNRSQVIDALCEAITGKFDPETNTLLPDSEKMKGEEITDKALKLKELEDNATVLTDALDASPVLTDEVLKKLKDKLSKGAELSENPSPDDIKNSMMQWVSANPMTRLAARLLRILTPRDWVNLPVDRRIVFSTRPNNVQRGLPASVLEAAALYSTEEQRLATIFDQGEGVEESIGPPNTSGYSFLASDLDKVLISIRRGKDYQYKATVYFVGKSGEELFRNEFSTLLRLGESMRYFELSASLADTTEKATKFNDEVIHYMKDLQNSMNLQYLNEEGETEQQALVNYGNRYLEPFKYEPLGYQTGSILLAYEQSKKQDFVALLSDNASFQGMFIGLEQWTWTPKIVKTLFKAEYTQLDAHADGSGQLLIIRPTTPSISRDAMRDRGRLQRLMDRSMVYDPLSSVLREYLKGNDIPSQISIDALYSTLATPFTDSMIGNFIQEPFFKFASELTEPQWNSLMAEQALFARQLSLPQRQELSRYIYDNNENWTTTVESSEEESDKPPQFAEITEILPNGIPNDLKIVFSVQKSAHLYLVPAAGEKIRVLSPSDMGWARAYSTHPNYLKSYQWVNNNNQFRIGESSSVTVTISVDPKVEVVAWFNDFKYDPGTKLYSFQSLPKEILTEIVQAEKLAIESIKQEQNQGADPGNSGVPLKLK